MSNEDKADYLNRYQNFFIAYILQNTFFGNNEKISQYFNLFTDGKNESLAKRLKKMKDKYPDSAALQNLFPLINQNRLSTDNIKMFNNKMSSYDINVISEAIDILYSQAEMIGDFELKEFIDNLARFAILQSGVQLSPVTFTKVLPLNLYAGLTADIFQNYINSKDEVDVKQIWKAFHQNNYKNNKIVPKQKYSRRLIKDGLVVIRSDRSIASNDYIKVYIPVNGVDEKADFNERFKLVLYEKIKITDATGKDVTLDKTVVKYRPINKLGNGMYLVETTPDPLTDASRFQINGDVNESMHDEAVMAWKKQVSTESIDTGLTEFDNLATQPSTSVQPKGTINVYWGQAESATSTRILSNLAPRKFSYESVDGITREYGSVEHAYQSNKNGKFDKVTYDAYNNLKEVPNKQGPGYGAKIAPKLTEVGKRANLQIMKDLVVTSFEQNPNSEAAKKLLQYENFTHNTNELIDKAFLEGLKLAQQRLLSSQQPTSVEGAQVVSGKTIKLKNGVTYGFSAINAKMLSDMGYTPEDIGKILKSIC
jgi:hypothetical protein